MKLSSIAELSSFLQAGDLLLLDIDETLVRPEADATEPWFNALCAALHEKSGVSKAVCFRAGVELWQALQAVCQSAAPEEAATINALAAAASLPGVMCVGLTARGPECHEETESQLAHCGIWHGVFATDSSLGELAPQAAGEWTAPLTHLHGIVYCSGSRKPAGLRAFEAASSIAPSRRVVLVDDREAHCQAVLDDRRNRGQPFLGLHYAPEGAAPSCELARGWQLFAEVLASPTAGRQRLRRMLELLDEAEGAPPPSGPPASSYSVALALVAGVTIGVGTALWLRR